ncbi:BirA family biotin operon repressor/biotin-[acetyl-CoA-carboxylase] ligase [Bacillus oleivorans]|uniref:Bifunctional ligase/repressor BirA n=1 Tax=Bacillus oleivorans TaxID=1448271 RepID=A0A285CKT3_9BACI|nr:biotin--[acetyl-CoA-carboxylase] ligase [Bacillus oleivorans]SNX68167.1 BirA family biotin operon repressor/biotin-[acetyl-CoA-carboxylase] ligase [Bacillus oleivorans]
MNSNKQILLSLFNESPGGYLSGQQIAEQLGCSRTAVWKQIQSLRDDGYEIEAIRNKGYRIADRPNGVKEYDIITGLETNCMGQNCYYFETAASTQKIAHELAQKGEPEGTLVLADQQQSGRGRMDRPWFSPKGTGIWMSLILRPRLLPSQTPQLTLLTAVAAAQAIEEVTGLTPSIKWPNDLMINDKKCTGILTELQAESDQVRYLIIGIGINVNQVKEDFPAELQALATSLRMSKQQEFPRAKLVQEILKRFEKLYELYLNQGFLPIKLLWESYSNTLGKMIQAKTMHGTIEGKAIGLTDEGVLVLEESNGTQHKIYSADIS